MIAAPLPEPWHTSGQWAWPAPNPGSASAGGSSLDGPPPVVGAAAGPVPPASAKSAGPHIWGLGRTLVAGAIAIALGVGGAAAVNASSLGDSQGGGGFGGFGGGRQFTNQLGNQFGGTGSQGGQGSTGQGSTGQGGLSQGQGGQFQGQLPSQGLGQGLGQGQQQGGTTGQGSVPGGGSSDSSGSSQADSTADRGGGPVPPGLAGPLAQQVTVVPTAELIERGRGGTETGTAVAAA
ncbi:hypothetical protein CcI49_29670 [Frankia sp. CcI49]|uniref:hypothetical protein n=1 Tax=Frankia sp. CcI49 TaxID=1745382 RepID=UPI0009CB02E5|nr:hypothetical protein [Frankia sp. CcI49]ONH54867.1 hypothetical protein CcI49_29670 [Frankia sp. CcI49]